MVRKLPPMMQDACLDYKKYKKLSKQNSTNDSSRIKNALVGDVNAVEHIFRMHTKDQKSTFCFRSCIFTLIPFTSHENSHLTLIYEYARLNTKCLYKICKRLDKRLGINTFMSWYEHVKMKRLYTFSNRYNHVCLSIDAAAFTPDECPICFESQSDKPYFVLACGHIVCQQCTFSLLGVSTAKGTTHNRIAYGCYTKPTASKCPICRDSSAFLEYKEYKHI